MLEDNLIESIVLSNYIYCESTYCKRKVFIEK